MKYWEDPAGRGFSSGINSTQGAGPRTSLFSRLDSIFHDDTSASLNNHPNRGEDKMVCLRVEGLGLPMVPPMKVFPISLTAL